MSGAVSFLSGLAAEAAVARHYTDTGRRVVAQRWRGTAGEIDLIAREGEGLVFVEVKHSRNHARAAEHLSSRQIARIHAAAAEYLATEPRGQATEVRFDVALVDAQGRIEVIENAFDL